jgi:hypothetical protein
MQEDLKQKHEAERLKLLQEVEAAKQAQLQAEVESQGVAAKFQSSVALLRAYQQRLKVIQDGNIQAESERAEKLRLQGEVERLRALLNDSAMDVALSTNQIQERSSLAELADAVMDARELSR